MHGLRSGTKTEALPLVCLPGLTRNSRDFHELALSLAAHPETPRQVVSFDYRGRGMSAYDPDWSHYNIGTEAGDIIAGLAHLKIDQAVFLGTSRGGLVIHILAAVAPQLLAGVILNDIGPEIALPGLNEISQYLNSPREPRPGGSGGSAMGGAWPRLPGADKGGLRALCAGDLPRGKWRDRSGLRFEPVKDDGKR